MPDVKGFHGLRFVEGRVGSLDNVLTPPYDVISTAERARLAELSSFNMVHVSLPEAQAGVTAYEAAAARLESWIAEGALRPDEEESLYLLEQVFEDPSGSQGTQPGAAVPHGRESQPGAAVLHVAGTQPGAAVPHDKESQPGAGVPLVRRGFLGLARLPEPGEKTILGHERTFSATLDDRMQLILATRANLEPVFVLYADAENQLGVFLDGMQGRAPDVAARTMDGVEQRVWRVPADAGVAKFFEGKRLYIADGHHRFHTACAYRDLMREKERPTGPRPYDYLLMGFVPLSDPGLLVFPTHRLMAKPAGFDVGRFFNALERWFEIARVDDDLPGKVSSALGCVIGASIAGEGNYLLKLRHVDRAALLGSDRGAAWRDLDVAVLHRGIVERVLGFSPETQFVYERDAAKALAAVERGEYGLAFLLKATRSEQIRACAEAGEPMPHKSTYFFPKLPSGAVLYALH